ncbi:UDP-glucuronosyltransferase 2A1 [Branchiostoma belcheri]|nr:UDP-glucuronosyltransferase 2A1 [Branchiostoma belcheri]
MHSCVSEKVLLVPAPGVNSHWMAVAKVGRALFEAFQDQGIEARLKTLQDNAHSVARKLSLYELLREIFVPAFGEFRNYCALLLGDSGLLGRLRASQYSVVVSDPVFPCGAILTAHLDFRVPHIAVTMLAGSLYDELGQKYDGEEETIQSVTSRTDLWLYRTDNVLDFPRPSMPNMVQVGGLNVREAAPLAEDMETFVQSSGEDGVIVVSFGSMIKTMPEDKREIFAAAFARLRQKVVWRYVGEKPAGLGNNTKLMGWLPQNDLLAHPKTRAFITHAGLNGVYEALHHGVPMVCLPLFWDQPANAARVVARGLGVTLDFSTVTADQLYQAILHVLTNSSYRETAARLSRLHRDQPQSPMERAVWWIEHVIQHSRLPHLRARAAELPWYQYYLLDVAAFLLSVCSAVLGTVWCGCSLICRRCCAKGGGKLKSQ